MMLGLALFGCRAPVDRISAGTLASTLSDHPGDVLVVDVRTSLEFHRGHIPGAVSLPWPMTGWNTDAITPTPGQTVVLVCLTGHRSRSPLSAMRAAHPHATFVDLDGGMQSWWAADLPLSPG